MDDLAFHPAANLFPLMTGAAYEELKADIAAYGQREPIYLYDGMILDGRNRYRACVELGAEPECTVYACDDPVAFVVSMNLKRRHLTPSQGAAVALDALPMLEAEARKRQGTRTDLLNVSEIVQQCGDHKRSSVEAASKFQTNMHYVHDAKRLRDEAPEIFERVRAGKTTIPEAKRELKEQQREKTREMNRELVRQTPAILTAATGQVFQTIVLDPPWDWGDEGDCDQYGRARPTYATMTIEQIMGLPVGDMAAKDAHLYLWITNRSLPKGFALLDHWGFRYVTMITWVKPSIGMGNYFRGTTEQVLFGVRGSLALLRHDVGTHFAADRPGAHSAKPDAFYALVESCSPGPWLEMFARKQRAGWITWGAEA